MIRQLFGASLVFVSISACGGGGGASGADGTTAAAVDDRFAGPVTSEDTAHGQARFDAMCGSCHPGGEADLGPAIKNLGWEPGRLRQQIRVGSGRMRPVSAERLSDEDMEAVLAYLATLGTLQ